MIHIASCEHFDGLEFLSVPIRENHGSRVPRTVSSFSVFWRPENSICAELCNPRFKGSKLFLSSFSAFRGLQMLFLPGHGSYDSNLPSSFLHFGGQKMLFQPSRGHTVQGYLDSCEVIF